ncbi:hypothetical protein FOHLNKBM_5524 [Methylobacterium longum]|uniref:hypothetical protein n=1 Tax=Methylobacterium longum TaxID=767694 RepID=UPI001EE24E90|nr:hypothetical protein [Methylobacterium longum]GJE14449.1 hypothetical protein FOHLNKBM_5524 [Methylobacterium longum]
MPRRKPEPRRPGPDHDDEPSDLTMAARRELVVEAALIFGEEAACELAGHLRVPFEADHSCAD